MRKTKGFTLIELLIVIALIAVLAGAVIIALNPSRQFAQARNSERWSHVSSIIGLVQQNISENRGVWTCAAGPLPTSTALIMADATSTPGGYDICSCLVPTYAASMPYDPSASGAGYSDCGTYNTQYTIIRDAATGRVTVSVPTANEELGASISITQ